MKKDYNAYFIIGGLVVLAFVLMWFGSRGAVGKPPETVADPLVLSGVQTTTAPWPPELANLAERLSTIGFQALSMEGTALHIHEHLDIYIDGIPTTVPAGIGITQVPLSYAPIHTHDATGIVHVESPTIQTFTLGQFFDVWGVRFTSDCIGGYCPDTANGKSLKVFVNGTQYSGDPRTLALVAHQEIVIAYGTDKELPNPIPSTFDFPPNY